MCPLFFYTRHTHAPLRLSSPGGSFPIHIRSHAHGHTLCTQIRSFSHGHTHSLTRALPLSLLSQPQTLFSFKIHTHTHTPAGSGLQLPRWKELVPTEVEMLPLLLQNKYIFLGVSFWRATERQRLGSPLQCSQRARGEAVQSKRSFGEGPGSSFISRIIKEPESFVTAVQRGVSKMGLRSPFPLREKNRASRGLRMLLP